MSYVFAAELKYFEGVWKTVLNKIKSFYLQVNDEDEKVDEGMRQERLASLSKTVELTDIMQSETNTGLDNAAFNSNGVKQNTHL